MGVEFLKVKSRLEVEEIIRSLPLIDAEKIPVDRACFRVVAEDIFAEDPVPHFNRATMDGYAVRSKDTFGASESLPSLLSVVGEIVIGTEPLCRIGKDEACSIPTGGALPDGADAVVMVEHTEKIDENTIEVYRPVAPGENVLIAGDDIAEGELLFERGHFLRPQDVGVLTAVGITTVEVYRIPRVAVISTGNEIVPPDTPSPLPPAVVRDINTYVVSGLVEATGATVGTKMLVPDNMERLNVAIRECLDGHDVVLISGGSSVGSRDFTLKVMESLPFAQILVHGVGMRPGKPTIFGVFGNKYIWGLPGQPGSVTMVMVALVCPFLQHIQGIEPSFPFSSRVIKGVLSKPVASVHGREDYIPVKFIKDDLIEPLFGKSGMIKVLASSDGYILIPAHSEGLDEGSEVDVYLF